MIIPPFNTPLMEILCEELQQRAANFQVIDCFPHDLYRFFLILRGEKQKEALFFCFKPPFIRFHLSQLPTSDSRSTHPLLSFLQGSTLNLAAILQQDRILELTFSTPHGERKLIAEFFSKHPNYYLIDAEKKILFTLHPSGQTHYQSPSPHSFTSPPPIWHTHREVELGYLDFEKQWELNQEKQKLETFFSKKTENLKKKERKLLDHLKKCDEWTLIQHEGDLIKSHFGVIKKGLSFIRVDDWITNRPYDLTIDPSKTAQEAMNARYKLAKKLQKGKLPLTKHLADTQKELCSLKELVQRLHLIKTIEELVKFKQPLTIYFQKNPSLPIAHLPPPAYKEYQSANGTKIWVGKNAKANERLTFQLANGRDWWLHVRGVPGSHVIIRMNKNEEPDTETLNDAFQLALQNSKARQMGEGEVCFTQRKYVSRLGQKKTGLVQISKHQTAWIRLDPVRLQSLKPIQSTTPS